MLYESAHLSLSAAGAVATLVVDRATADELLHTLALVERSPHLERLVIRSAHAHVFELPHSDSLLERLAQLPVITIAWLEGVCRCAALEFALACQYRLAVASPDTWLGFAAGPLGGNTLQRVPRACRAQLVRGESLDARTAWRGGLVDDAFTMRRAKIELNSWLDRVRFRTPRKYWTRAANVTIPDVAAPIVVPTLELPNSVGIVACPAATPIAVELLLRGRTVTTDQPEAVRSALRAAGHRVTPWELEQAEKRLQHDAWSHVEYLLLSETAAAPPVRKHTRIVRIGGEACPWPWLAWSGVGWTTMRHESRVALRAAA